MSDADMFSAKTCNMHTPTCASRYMWRAGIYIQRQISGSMSLAGAQTHKQAMLQTSRGVLVLHMFVALADKLTFLAGRLQNYSR